MQAVDVRLAGLAMAAFVAATSASPAFAAGPPTSSAFGVSAVVQSQGTATNLPAVAYISGGNTTAKFDRRALAPFVSEALGLVSAGNLVGEVIVTVASIATHASSTGTHVTPAVAEADESIGSVKIMVELLPTPGGTAPPPLLTLTATKLATSLTDTLSLPAVSVFTGTAKFGSLTLGGSLVGTTPLIYFGAAPANTVLFDSPTVTVTLNKQVVTGSIACTPQCQFVPAAMNAQALSIYISGAKVLGKPFSGNIVVGATQAQIP